MSQTINRNINNFQFSSEIDSQQFNSKNLLLKNNNFETKKINNFKNLNVYFIFICFLFVLLFLNYYKLSKLSELINNKILIKYNENGYLNKNDSKKENIKLCICTLGKEENKYIREFVEFYENHGIDKIFLYDNNDIDGEKFEEVIKDYVDKGFVQILNWRGTRKTQFIILDDCYRRNNNNYDWLFFYDIDEYIHLKNYTNIKNFLNEKKFENCLKIYLNWVIHTDNNLIYYDNRSLHERFPDIEPNAKKNIKGVEHRVKCILRGHNNNNDITCWELISKKYKGCNGYGEEAQLINRAYMKNTDFENYYIDHYYSKSVEEFVKKVNKGDGFFEKKTNYKKHRIKRYFKFNEITLEKIEYIERKTGINLNNYKKQLKSNKKK